MAPVKLNGPARSVTDEVAKHTAAAEWQITIRGEVQACEPAGTEYREHETDGNQCGHARIARAVILAVQKNTRGGHTGKQREQKSDIAKQMQEHIGQPRTGAPTQILHLAGGTAVRPARIGGVISPERNKQVDSDRDKEIKTGLAQHTKHLWGQGRPLFAFPGCLRHNTPRGG